MSVPFVGPVMMASPEAWMAVLRAPDRRAPNSPHSPKLPFPQCGSGKADYPEWPPYSSPPPCLKAACRGINPKMTVAVLSLTPPASPSSTLGSPAVLRRPSQHGGAMRACRNLRVRAPRNGANSGDFLRALTCWSRSSSSRGDSAT